jgi:hypothetical protein
MRHSSTHNIKTINEIKNKWHHSKKQKTQNDNDKKIVKNKIFYIQIDKCCFKIILNYLFKKLFAKMFIGTF